jgi:hypothetical protein
MGKHDDTVDRTNAARTPRRIESSEDFTTTYESWTAEVTQRFNELIATRPEVRNEYAYQRAAVGQEAKKTRIAGWCR